MYRPLDAPNHRASLDRRVALRPRRAWARSIYEPSQWHAFGMWSGMRLLVLVLASACSVSTGFDMPFEVPELTVWGDPQAHAAGVPLEGSAAPFAFRLNLDHQQQQNQMPGVISNVVLTSMTFSITKNSGCFDFVDDISLAITSTKAGSELPTVVIATGSKPGCVDSFLLTPAAVNLKPYLDEGATIRASGSGVPPAHDVTFTGHVMLHASL